MLGNAATNIAFPVTTISTAAALLLGIGGASNYNLEMGAGKERKASEIAGSALATLVITGVSVAAIILLFLHPLLVFFGATDTVMPYATDYVSIIAIGLPFFTLSRRRKPSYPRRPQSYVFHDVYPDRCHYQYDS